MGETDRGKNAEKYRARMWDKKERKKVSVCVKME